MHGVMNESGGEVGVFFLFFVMSERSIFMGVALIGRFSNGAMLLIRILFVPTQLLACTIHRL